MTVKKRTCNIAASTFFMIFFALVMAVSSSANAAGVKKVTILTCPLGCGAVKTQTVLAAHMIRGGSDLLPMAQETPGFMYNIQAMHDKSLWKDTLFGTEDTVIQAAPQGGKGDLKQFLPKKIPVKFQLLYGEGLVSQGKFFVTMNPKIKSIADLKGKTISVGLVTQSDWGMSAMLLLKAGYGITPENTTIRHVTPTVMTQQLINGNTDAALMALLSNVNGDVWWTASLTSQLAASGKTIHYLAPSKEAIAKVNKDYSMTWTPLTVPAGTLPDQKEPLLVGANHIYMAAAPNFPPEAAYKVVKAVAKYGPELKKVGQGWWRYWSPENMVAGLSEKNTNPGAIKAYKELGWWDLRKQFEPMTYPESAQAKGEN